MRPMDRWVTVCTGLHRDPCAYILACCIGGSSRVPCDYKSLEGCQSCATKLIEEQPWTRGIRRPTDVCNALAYTFGGSFGVHSKLQDPPWRTADAQQARGRLSRIPKKFGRFLDPGS